MCLCLLLCNVLGCYNLNLFTSPTSRHLQTLEIDTLFYVPKTKTFQSLQIKFEKLNSIIISGCLFKYFAIDS